MAEQPEYSGVEVQGEENAEIAASISNQEDSSAAPAEQPTEAVDASRNTPEPDAPENGSHAGVDESQKPTNAKRLFVRGVKYDLSVEALKEFFSQFGTLATLSKGKRDFCFVEYTTDEDAATAFGKIKEGLELEGKKLTAQIATQREKDPDSGKCFKCGENGHIARNCKSGLPDRRDRGPDRRGRDGGRPYERDRRASGGGYRDSRSDRDEWYREGRGGYDGYGYGGGYSRPPPRGYDYDPYYDRGYDRHYAPPPAYGYDDPYYAPYPPPPPAYGPRYDYPPPAYDMPQGRPSGFDVGPRSGFDRRY